MGGFDYLRLIAAILVIAHHARVLNGEPPIMIGTSLDLGALGVGVFFVISGYLVSGSLERTPRLWSFIAKRALRIFPGLLAALLVTAFVIGPASTALARSDYLASPEVYGYVLKNLTLYAVTYDLPGVFLAAPVAGVVNGSLWTLRLEFTAYLALAALGAARQVKPRVLTVLALAAAASAIAIHALGLDARGDLYRIAYLAAINGFLFLSGAALRTSAWRAPSWLAVAALIPLITPLWFLGLPLIALRLGALNAPRAPVDLSYGLYIYSFPLQQMLAERSQLNLATSLALTLPFALASWLLVEKPALRLKARLPPAPAKPVLNPVAALGD
ncbi:acyltransferase [Caulobacter segnis]|uniref:acyltransferase family protein n=1 Tax=Caulobacter segnis TaxID=88688 RepID=UPI002856D4B1|nr:acyltransferase [Caulobacter segnis]MDR6627489.1 peptidoglycan/LPS O-acetylase OafA/YrhL [Caulobacter segnis]